MATENPVLISGLVAGADLSTKQFQAVTISADRTVAIAGAGDVFGVLQNKPVSGAFASVCVGGVGKCIAGDTIVAGDPLTSEITTGRLVPMTSLTEVNQVGTALEAAADGDVIAYLANPPIKTTFSLST